MVTDASLKYFSHEKRGCTIRFKQVSRQMFRAESSQDLADVNKVSDANKD